MTLTITKHRNLNWLMAIMFMPLLSSFLLPLLFYDLPLNYKFFNKRVVLDSVDILNATIVWLAWIGIAVITPLLLSRIKNPTSSERPWSLVSIWRGFIVLTFVGVLIVPLHYFFSFHSGIEQLIQQLSFAPVVAVLVGIRALKNINLSDKRQSFLMFFGVVLLLGINLAIAIVFPVLMGKAAPGVYASLAILYGVHALKLEKKKQIAIWLVFFAFACIALAFKGNFRSSSFGSMFWYEGQFIRIPFSDALNIGIQEAYKKTILNKKSLRTLEDRPLSSQTEGGFFDANKTFFENDYYYSKPAEYINYDLNYHRIRFFSPDDYIPEYAKYLVAKSIERINHLGDLAHAIRITPESIPYMNGSTYYPLLYKPIPRLFWKDKPEDNSGQIYGHRYGLLDESDKTTSANMGVVIEAWINGGWTVLTISGFAFGVLIYFTWRYLIGESCEIGNIVLGAVFVASGVATESSMNLVMGGMFYCLLTWWAIEYLIRTKL